MKKPLIISFTLIVIIVSFILKSDVLQTNSNDSIKFILWEDFIQFNGRKYRSIGDGVISNPTLIGDKIGEVEFKVADNITDTNYVIKEGDAAFWDKGTDIYEITGLPIEDFIAVKDENKINGYRIYYFSDMDYIWRYKYIDKDKINKIEIYDRKVHNYRVSKPELIRTLKNKDDIKDFITILDNGVVHKKYIPNVAFGDPIRKQVVIYTDDIISFETSISYYGEEYIWSPSYIEILPNEIKKYIE